MHDKCCYFTVGCKSAESKPVKKPSAIRPSIKAGLLGILGMERQFLDTLLDAKKHYPELSGKDFEGVLEYVDEVKELEESLKTVITLYTTIEEL